MTLRRGALTAPPYVGPKQTFNLGSAPVRYKAKPVLGEPYADQLRAALEPLIKTNDSTGA